MSRRTYWLSRQDAEFVICAVARYDHVTRSRAEQASPDTPDPVYEIIVTRHGRMILPVLPKDVAYPTLKAALLADERASLDAEFSADETSDFIG